MFSSTIYSTGGRPGCRTGRHGGDPGFAYGPRGEFGGFGFGGGFGGGPRGRGRRARRGDIRTAALLLLAEEPRNGYQIMQEVQERSGGTWSPSPGSVYPALSQLEDEGLIATEEHDGRKAYVLTDAGRKLVQERDSERPAPWDPQDLDRGEAHELGRLMREVASAFVQVIKTGSPEQMGRAREVLNTTRRDLYRILADGDIGGGESAGRPEDGGEAGTVDGNS
ncbi:MAG TPA: PadR family transcriptional regulator [Solirubrobacteraceae bacterium]|jgi:DNA-binding PadR family transcriptional regulator|nr:PadR family transcriptional regulator [Solirubrobacteraceae bacterium]